MATQTTDIEIHSIIGSEIEINFGEKYIEHGAIAYHRPSNTLLDAAVSGSVDPLTAGTYVITYRAEYGEYYNETTLTVTVGAPGLEFTLRGTDPFEHNLGDPYSDPGAVLLDKTTNTELEFETDSSGVDVDTVGDYTVYYRYMDGEQQVEVTRTVQVRDIKGPEILFTIGSLGNEEEYQWEKDDPITEEMLKGLVTLTDNLDTEETLRSALVLTYFHLSYDPETEITTETEGPLEDFDVSDPTARMIVRYNVADASGNAADQAELYLRVNLSEPPVITLLGDNPMTLELEGTYTDPGFTAVDAIGRDISSLVFAEYEGNPLDEVAGEIGQSFGTKSIDYSVGDQWGNTATVQREINVVTTTAPVITVLESTSNLDRLSSVEDSYFLQFISVESLADGADLINSVVVDQSSIDYGVHGTYTITFNVTDSFGNQAVEATMEINIVNTTPPTYSFDLESSDRYIDQGDTYTEARLLAGVEFRDYLDNIIPEESIEVDFMIFDSSILGTQYARYRAVDDTGVYTDWISAVIYVRYAGEPVLTNSISTEKAQLSDPYTVEDAMVGITATSATGVSLTGYVHADISGVDTDTLGTYTVTYDLTDPVNGTAAPQVTRTVEVVNEVELYIIDEHEVAMFEVNHVADQAERIEGIKIIDSRGTEYPVDQIIVDDQCSYDLPGEYSINYSYLIDGGISASYSRRVVVVERDVKDRIFLNFRLPGGISKVEIYRSEDDTDYKFIHRYEEGED